MDRDALLEHIVGMEMLHDVVAVGDIDRPRPHAEVEPVEDAQLDVVGLARCEEGVGDVEPDSHADMRRHGQRHGPVAGTELEKCRATVEKGRSSWNWERPTRRERPDRSPRTSGCCAIRSLRSR